MRFAVICRDLSSPTRQQTAATDDMLDTVHFIGMPSEDAMKRLIQGGVEVQFYPAMCVEMAAEHVGSNKPLMLGIEPVPHAMLSWKDVAPEQADLGAEGRIPSTDDIIRAIVQYNRRQPDQGAPATAGGTSAATSKTASGAQTASTAAAADTGLGAGLADQPGCEQPLLVVGYVMKASREEALASAHMLHLLPQEGMCFMPVDLDTLQQQPYEQQHPDQDLQQHQQQQQSPAVPFDILLHKGSDELIALPSSSNSSDTATAAAADSGAAAAAVDGGCSGPGAVGVCWSPRLVALQSWLAAHPQVCVVDPFEHTAKVLDRLLLARLLQQLQSLQLPCGVKARGPAFYEVAAFDADSVAAVTAAGLQPPFIVKPRVACGVSHSHSMALVLSTSALQQLQGQLPTPALVQEFVNHGGQQYKVYVMGEQVFVTPRASIPDIHINSSPTEQQQQQQCLLFDSLASLPTQLPTHCTQQQQQQEDGTGAAATASAPQPPVQPPQQQAVEAVAACLRQHLGLTLFGVDVVVATHPRSSTTQPQSATVEQQHQQHQGPQVQQELVVIDVNYFPNYRGGTNTPTLFRAALREAWQQHQQRLRAQQS